jgi:adenosylcobinamide-phosphate synthase
VTLSTSAIGGVHAASAVGLALVLEAAVGEPPTRIHPVAWFGTVVELFDREWNRPHLVGPVVATLLPLLAAVVVAGLVLGAARVNLLAGVAVAGAALFTTTSLRMLLGEARSVIAATESDVASAREQLLALAGRDAGDLSAAEVRSAAVESAAENLADGLVAPLLAFALGAAVSLPVAAAAAAWVKAVNTLDSMLGYRAKRVGTASARLDDAVMWAPARVSALLVAATSLDPGAVWRASAHARAPPSPNSGWPMATLAAALSVRLEKPGSYELPYGASLPTASDGARAVRVVGMAGLLSYALAGLGVVAWY